MDPSRRDVLAAAALAPLVRLPGGGAPAPPRISLAEWSLHRAIRGGKLAHLDFARTAREAYELEGVEYVNQFFADKATSFEYLGEMRKRAADAGVKSLLIMIDGEGPLADVDVASRNRAIENHFDWIAAAAFLGCHSIRVNAAGSGSREAQLDAMTDSLQRLGAVADGYGVNVLVENHGGLSSDGSWLAAVMKKAAHPRVGTLPDFGNFGSYDRYRGVEELIPFAKALSAKSHDFDDAGNETSIDYVRMATIALAAGYSGWVGVEYEGERLPEPEGVKRTIELVKRAWAKAAETK